VEVNQARAIDVGQLLSNAHGAVAGHASVFAARVEVVRWHLGLLVHVEKKREVVSGFSGATQAAHAVR
jgi:hypothetical protein